ncbi:hypothetical protein SK128_024624, partial [Halocaridina rubra]
MSSSMMDFQHRQQNSFALYLLVLLAITMNSNVVNAQICPDPGMIYPCVCDISGMGKMNMFCEGITSTTELESLFMQDFPDNNFHILSIDNSYLDILTSGILNSKSFEEITIWQSGLQRVDFGALNSSYNTLSIIRMDVNTLVSFPFEELSFYTNLIRIDLTGNTLTELSTIASDSLEEFFLETNLITHIPVTTFRQLPNVNTIFLGNNTIEEVLSGTFTGQPNLNILTLNNNRLPELLAGTVELHGPDSRLIFSNNNISRIEPDAFR